MPAPPPSDQPPSFLDPAWSARFDRALLLFALVMLAAAGVSWLLKSRENAPAVLHVWPVTGNATVDKATRLFDRLDAAYSKTLALVERSPVGPGTHHADATQHAAMYVRLTGDAKANGDAYLAENAGNLNAAHPVMLHLRAATESYADAAEQLRSYVETSDRAQLAAAKQRREEARGEVEAMRRVLFGAPGGFGLPTR